jgi:hypothetical protein
MPKTFLIACLAFFLSSLGAQRLMIGMRHTEKSPSFADTLGEFYLRDSTAIAQFMHGIDAGQPQVNNRCGVHYYLWIKTDHDPSPAFLSLSLACNTIFWKGQTFTFDVAKLRPLMEVARTPKIRVLDFPNIDAARKGYADMKSDHRLLYVEEPEWIRFDGMAEYTFSCERTAFDCLEMRAKIVAHLREKIMQGLLEIPLDIRIVGGNRTHVKLDIHTVTSVGKELPYRLGDSQVVWTPYRRFYVKTWWE